MPEMRFTPGPWKRYERTDGGLVVTTQKGLSPVSIANVVIRRDLHEFQANAHLIAAAPDLLDVLIELKEWIDCLDPPFTQDLEWPETEEKLKAALAKARGEAQS